VILRIILTFIILQPWLALGSESSICRSWQLPFIGKTVPNCRDNAFLAFNSQGVRSEEPAAPSKNELRILLLGGGRLAAENLPLALTFAKRLEFHLHRLSGRKIKVINATAEHSSPLEELRGLQGLLRAYKPNLVYFTMNGPAEFLDTCQLSHWYTWKNNGEITEQRIDFNKNYLFKFYVWLFRVPENVVTPLYWDLAWQIGLAHCTHGPLPHASAAEELMAPFVEVLSSIHKLSSEANAKFYVLYNGLGIRTYGKALSPSANGAAYVAMKILTALSRKVFATKDEIILELNRKNLNTVISIQAGRQELGFFNSRQRSAPFPPELIDSLAQDYSIALFANGFP
jgi:hypothetical protein